MWEFQVLAATGIGVFYCNPRGSEGYGEAFNDANHRDWGPGPMRDVLAGVDALVADGVADPDRLGVTGGSYGGYLTNWIIAHDERFRAAMTCRSVSDMGVLFTTGDISGGEWARLEFDATPWDDPVYFREISPLAYAERIRTPLLIQHAERDIRTTIAQAEALFTVLRSHHRPVRLMRVPDETHELDAFRHPVPEDREPPDRRRLVPPLPRGWEASAAVTAKGPRRALAVVPGDVTQGLGTARLRSTKEERLRRQVDPDRCRSTPEPVMTTGCSVDRRRSDPTEGTGGTTDRDFAPFPRSRWRHPCEAR